MLRNLFRFLFPAPQKPAPIDTVRKPEMNGTAPQVVLYAQVPAERGNQRRETAVSRTVAEPINHRARLMAMKLEHTQLCSPKRCERLAEYGIVTAGDLASCDPTSIASKFAAPAKALRTLRRYRRAVRLSAAIPGMMPREAQLLISIHRRSVRGLARETAAVLRRDLERFAESSDGQRQLKGRRLPSTRRIKRWISECENHVSNVPVHIAA